MPAYRTRVHNPEPLTPGVPAPEPDLASGWVKTRAAPKEPEPPKTAKKAEDPPAKGSSNSKKRP
jgi:hypothetical protein